MAKRGPEEQLTKDDYNSDGEGGGDEVGGILCVALTASRESARRLSSPSRAGSE